jgi:hypothetical protein
VHVPVTNLTDVAINLPEEVQMIAAKISGDSLPVIIPGRALPAQRAAQLTLALLASQRHECADLQPIIKPIKA